VLQWGKKMNSLAKHNCLCAWLLAFIAQCIVITFAPESLVVSGVDIGHTNKLALFHTLVFVNFGLALAIAAYIAKSWDRVFDCTIFNTVVSVQVSIQIRSNRGCKGDLPNRVQYQCYVGV
jgi:hypothetical protein